MCVYIYIYIYIYTYMCIYVYMYIYNTYTKACSGGSTCPSRSTSATACDSRGRRTSRTLSGRARRLLHYIILCYIVYFMYMYIYIYIYIYIYTYVQREREREKTRWSEASRPDQTFWRLIRDSSSRFGLKFGTDWQLYSNMIYHSILFSQIDYALM